MQHDEFEAEDLGEPVCHTMYIQQDAPCDQGGSQVLRRNSRRNKWF